MTYLGRNHPFVAALAQYLLEAALNQTPGVQVSRCGVIRTQAVSRRTAIMLLRLRFLLEQPDRPPLLSEETFIAGFRGFPDKSGFNNPPDRLALERSEGLEWLPDEEALALLQTIQSEGNIPDSERRENLDEILGWWDDIQEYLDDLINHRANNLDEAHRRVRASARLIRRGLKVQPQLPPDLLGVLVLLPVPKGVMR